jgi:hypothetical protein
LPKFVAGNHDASSQEIDEKNISFRQGLPSSGPRIVPHTKWRPRT